VDGKTELAELCEVLGEHFKTGAFQTAAGLVLDHLGRFPQEGETFQIGRYRVEIIDMDERRIDKLLFRAERGRHEL
jgi:putative hemolysin